MTSTYQGRLLLGAPDLQDPNFFRSVVLLVDHSESGALGVILNRPTDTTLTRVWQEVSDEPCLREAFLHHGGPCEGLLSALHTDAECGQVEVCDGLYFTAEAPLLAQLVEDSEKPVEARFFVGYAGWGPEQLETEVEQGGWLLTPTAKQDVFTDVETIWPRILKRVSPSWATLTFNPSIVPEDPSQN
jgi:putative transcriptional regulator